MHSITALLSLFIVLLASTPCWAANPLPELGHPSERVLSPEEEKLMGRAFVRALKAQDALLEDELISDYIQTLGQRLASHSPEQNRDFNFFVINANDINAFAGPNATIGINKGLILAARNESQLASVMAHEIAHVTQRHLTRAFQAHQDTSLTTLATVLAAILVSSSNPDASTALLMGGLAGGMQRQINFTRNNEHEADRVGIQILSNSNLSPNGMVEFFEILQSSSFYGSESDIEYLRTHPLNSTRIAEAASRTPKVSWSTPNDSLMFRLSKQRLIVANSNNLEELKKNYPLKAGLPQSKVYARALIDMRQNKTHAAIKTLKTLTKQNDHLWYELSLAKSYLLAKRQTQSLTLYKELAELYPSYLPVVHQYALALIHFNKFKQSIDILEKELVDNNNSTTYKLLALSYSKQKNLMKAYVTRAKQYANEGLYEFAIQQINSALRLPENTPESTKRLQAKIEIYKKSYKTE